MASDTLAKIDRARAAVAELNYGAREWKGLHEPASEDATDVVIMEALRCAALEISRLSRELEAARELLRQIAADRCRCLHPFDICGNCRARRAFATDTEGGDADPPAYPARMAQPDEEIAL